MRYLKSIATALAVSVGALSLPATAEAGHRHRHHNNGGAAVAAGIFGLAAGTIIGGALSGPRYGYYDRGYYGDGYDDGYYGGPGVVYVEPEPVYVPRRAVVYQNSYEPWSPEWYAYCDSRYQSFDPDTGYFKGYDRKYHFCR